MAEKLVKELIKANKVMIFSKSYCPYCTMAKQVSWIVQWQYEDASESSIYFLAIPKVELQFHFTRDRGSCRLQWDSGCVGSDDRRDECAACFHQWRIRWRWNWREEVVWRWQTCWNVGLKLRVVELTHNSTIYEEAIQIFISLQSIFDLFIYYIMWWI